MPRRSWDFSWRINKRSFVITLGLCVSVLYLSYTFNFCLLSNLNRTFRQHRGRFISLITPSPKTIQNEPNELNENSGKQTVVRFVPLTWSGIFESDLKVSNESDWPVDGAPKYRFLRQQGLRPTRKFPDTLIIGVKKGGTRALLEFIRLHPDVRAAGSEVHFFDRFYSKGLQWYRHHMPPTLEGQVTMEKTPSYFVTREVPLRVHQMNPATKLLVVVRDPVTRAISDYTQAASKKPGMRKFEELAFLNGSSGAGLVDTSWGPVKIGVYARHLERWLQCFSLNQLLFVSGERLIVDPAAEITRVQDFLGLKRVVTEKHFYFNSTKGFPCLMKSEGHPSPHCLGKTKGRNHPHIDPVAIQRLREFYRPFNARFYQLTGVCFRELLIPFTAMAYWLNLYKTEKSAIASHFWEKTKKLKIIHNQTHSRWEQIQTQYIRKHLHSPELKMPIKLGNYIFCIVPIPFKFIRWPPDETPSPRIQYAIAEDRK